MVCGKRLAWGYVDQPPLGPLLARAAWALSGEGGSVLAFRLPSIALGAASALLAALLARRLGGGAFAMALAALSVAAAPGQVAQAHLVTMNAIEPALWTGVVLEQNPVGVLVAATGLAFLLAGTRIGTPRLEGHGEPSVRWLGLGLVLAALVALGAKRYI